MKTIMLTPFLFLLLNIPNEKFQQLTSQGKNICSERIAPPQPQIFSEGIISTDEDEFGSTISPDGKTIFFCKKSPSGLRSAVVVICYSELKNGKWQTPKVAPFSGKYKDFNPSFSPDGSTLYFVSVRPPEEGKAPRVDIWRVKKMATGWSNAENLGAPINGEGYQLGCSVAANGTLYFSSTRDRKSVDIYRSKLLDGKYQEPESLGDAVNTDFDESDVFVAPDESYILFASTGRDDALASTEGGVYPRGDLYISFQKEGNWTTPKNLGAPINSAAEESNPFVSADGKTLYFTSERNFVILSASINYADLENHLHSVANGLGDIYEVPFNLFNK